MLIYTMTDWSPRNGSFFLAFCFREFWGGARETAVRLIDNPYPKYYLFSQSLTRPLVPVISPHLPNPFKASDNNSWPGWGYLHTSGPRIKIRLHILKYLVKQLCTSLGWREGALVGSPLLPRRLLEGREEFWSK